jgi:hypothetical protein
MGERHLTLRWTCGEPGDGEREKPAFSGGQRAEGGSTRPGPLIRGAHAKARWAAVLGVLLRQEQHLGWLAAKPAGAVVPVCLRVSVGHIKPRFAWLFRGTLTALSDTERG